MPHGPFGNLAKNISYLSSHRHRMVGHYDFPFVVGGGASVLLLLLRELERRRLPPPHPPPHPPPPPPRFQPPNCPPHPCYFALPSLYPLILSQISPEEGEHHSPRCSHPHYPRLVWIMRGM